MNGPPGKTSPYRVLMLTSTFPERPGDAVPTFVYDLSRTLAGYDDLAVHVLTPHVPGARIRELRDGISILRYRYFSPERLELLCHGSGILPNLSRNRLLAFEVPFFLLSQLLHLHRMVRKSGIDLVHAHWLFPQGFLACLYKRWFNPSLPVICSVHGGDLYGLRTEPFVGMNRFTVKRADRMIPVSSSLGDSIRNDLWRRARLTTISMGFDAAKFLPTDSRAALKKRLFDHEGPIILFVGRLVEKKGISYLLEAVPDVVAEAPDTLFVLVGGGHLEDTIRNRIRRLGVEGRVRMTGFVDHSRLPRYYAAADVFVGPSIVTASGDTEGFGLTFAEASASGCAVVATNVGGIRDVVIHGKTGILVPEKDSGAIREAILYLIRHPEMRTDMGLQGRAHATEHFDWKVVGKRFRREYLDVLESNEHRRPDR